MSTLDNIIDNATASADVAVINAIQQGRVRTKAEETRVAVDAAIRSALANGVLEVAGDADERMAFPGYRISGWGDL